MPRKKTIRKVKFAQAVFAGKTQAQAARAAGCAPGAGLEAQASRLMHDPEVVAEIDRLRKEHEAKAVATRQEILETLTRHLRGDLSQFVDAKGRVSLQKALRAKQFAQLESLNITVDGIKLKLHSVQGAAERLARLLGLNAPEKINLTRAVESMTEAELMAELAKLEGNNDGSREPVSV